MNNRFKDALKQELDRLNTIKQQSLSSGSFPQLVRQDFSSRLVHSTMRYYMRSKRTGVLMQLLKSLFAFTTPPLSYGK